MYRSLSSFVPKAEDLLELEMDALGNILLTHLKSYEHVRSNSVYQNGLLSLNNFILMQEQRQPEYGDKQPEVTRALTEAWSWLEHRGFLVRDPKQPAPWFYISRLGESAIKGAENGATATKPHRASNSLPLIADSRLAELRALSSAQFDFKKLIQLCEEINTAYGKACYLATAMLTRGLLDHVPPIFGKAKFSEVANNYSGGGRSFAEMMHRLENAARKVADAYLHNPIRKTESLPTPQQVNFAAELDMLLSEIVRITR